ncbi:ankyrin repeat domain-containing protein [Deefgea tanakiae]|uniref:Ankyrin repeat domain-containing protein n=1 Tax=Deefgea tanakiae TaxID=2865840 RepID=A0ABX8ZA54_9NEIS|nr:ankyrin repeat domain-containing protein [Deefgea tanakiae]QZA77749.1 ankyrin repeat domain-containing protein [Deefgea tanakiae]
MLNVQFLINHLKESLSPALYPSQLEARYPKVLARIMLSWEKGDLDACFNDLLIQDDQQQDGFPPDVATELFRLQIVLDSLKPQAEDVWGHIRSDKIDPADIQTLNHHGHKVNSEGLNRAIEQRQFGLLPVFVRAGLSIEQKDEAGWTPIMHACFAGKLDVVIQLIKLGANLGVKDQHGYSLLHWAALNGNPDLVALLIGHELNPVQASNKGITPLMQAAAGGHILAMQYIVAQGGSVAINARSYEGWTALHKATANKQVAAALWLAERGANPHQQNQQGESACSLALKLNQPRLYELLSESADRQTNTIEWQLA